MLSMNVAVPSRPLFRLGRIVATPGAMRALAGARQPLHSFLIRHVTGDWNDMCEEDREWNRVAINQGIRIFSAYRYSDNDRLWIITEPDRQVTTVLLPSEH